MRPYGWVLGAAAFFAAAPAEAGIITFNLNSPPGTLGATQTYTVGGATITAHGYTGLGSPHLTPTQLFGKNQGGDESGLGLVGASDHEIEHRNGGLIQFDLAALLNSRFSDGQIKIGSVQEGEGFDLYGSNTLGDPGAKLMSFGTLNDQFFDIPGFGSYRYLGVAAAHADVLVEALAVDPATVVPEPATLTLCSLGLGGFAAVAAWRRGRRVGAA
jgi:hypothetical protein